MNYRLGQEVSFTVPQRLSVLEQTYVAPGTGRAVYKVRDSRTGLTYALKVFRLTKGQNLREIEHEVRALNGQIDAPDRLPRVRAFEQQGEFGLMLMDWISGTPLDRFVAAQPARTPSELATRLRIVAELCTTVSHLHQSRFFHRDLKPQNILVRNTRNPAAGVAVLDLGLSSQDRSDTEGTEGYAAPEQNGFRNYSLSARTDIFAVGQILAYVIIARPLVLRPGPDLNSWAEPASALLARQHAMAVPESVMQCLDQCTRLIPDERPSDIRSVGRTLLQQVRR